MHVWDDGTPLEETLSTLDMLVRKGTVLKDNLATADWSLTTEQADRLTAASATETPPYPYCLLARFALR